MITKLCKTLEVGRWLIHRREIELEVTGMHDRAIRCMHRDGSGIRDGVCDAEKLHLHLAEFNGLPVLGSVQTSLRRQFFFIETLADEAHRKLGAVTRREVQ